MNHRASIAAWLLDGGHPLPPASALRRFNLGAYAYTVAHPADRQHEEVRADYLSSLVRHQRIKAELLPLLRAWAEAGVEVLLFKGFHLAEFVYPVPGARFHGDVDVVVRPHDVARARQVARAAGWREENDTELIGKEYFHNVCSLMGPEGNTCVDLHRWVIHCELPWTRVPRRISEAVWSASRERLWEGVRVREMSEADALLVGLVLQRCWGGERWQLKVHDPIDFRLLSRRVPREVLHQRSRELGVVRTLRRFLERCDPAAGVLSLDRPSRGVRWRSDVAAFSERGPLGPIGKVVRTLVNSRHWAAATVRMVPRLIAARRAVCRHPDPASLLQAVHPTPRAPVTDADPIRRHYATRAALHLSRLFPANRKGDCLARSLAVYVELRRQGWPVRFVSGVRRDADGVMGHAWVELDGGVLPELCEPGNRRNYRVNFIFPADGAGDPLQGEGSAAENQPPRVDRRDEGGNEARHRCA